MSLLILLRHAKAVGYNDAPTDRDRPLTERGRNDAKIAGQKLAAAPFGAALALVSPALRTAQTWDGVAVELKPAPAPAFVDALYQADAAALWRLARENGAGRDVLVVGHNPALHDLAVALIRQLAAVPPQAAPFLDGFPTSAWLAFDCAGESLAVAEPSFLGAWRPERD